MIPIDNSWASGKLNVRPGESLEFDGQATGIGAELTIIFHADGDGVWHYKNAEADNNCFAADPSAGGLAIKHVEMALIDAGFRVEPVAASEDYGKDES